MVHGIDHCHYLKSSYVRVYNCLDLFPNNGPRQILNAQNCILPPISHFMDNNILHSVWSHMWLFESFILYWDVYDIHLGPNSCDLSHEYVQGSMAHA